MAFTHDLLDLPPISSEDTDNGRFYDTPAGRFPSVTTVIGWHEGDSWKKDWMAKVGADQAQRVGTRARLRGTAFHSVAESYVMNDTDWHVGVMPSLLHSFLEIKKFLDENVGVVRAVEAPLWSPVLRTAGRTDLIAEWNGILSIIDFKTSVRVKTEEKIWGYFVQKACYGQMVEELTEIRVPQIVTVMAVDHERPSIWVKRRSDYEEAVRSVFITTPRPEGL